MLLFQISMCRLPTPGTVFSSTNGGQLTALRRSWEKGIRKESGRSPSAWKVESRGLSQVWGG